MLRDVDDVLRDIESPDTSLTRKIDCLVSLSETIDQHGLSSAELRQLMTRMIQLLPQIQEWKLQLHIFENIARAYMRRGDVRLHLSPMIEGMRDADPQYLASALEVLAMTWDGQYRPIVEQYLDHPDEKVRREAEDAFATLAE